MKNLITTLFVFMLVLLVLFGLVKVDIYTYDYINHVYTWLESGTVVQIVRVALPNCLVWWDNSAAAIPCDNLYFMGRGE